MKVKVVCFDLDDTLCDYERSATLSRKKMMSHALSVCPGLTVPQFQQVYQKTFQDMITHYHGPAIFLQLSGYQTRLEHVRRILLECGCDNGQRAQELVEVYGRERRKTLRLFPDARSVLSSLQGQYRLSLVTNGPSDIQRQEIADLQLAHYFDDIIVAGEVGYAKPDPRIFHILIEHLNIPASQIVYIGNSQLTDLPAATAAGLKVIWINRNRETRIPGGPQPDYEITSLTELLNILKKSQVE